MTPKPLADIAREVYGASGHVRPPVKAAAERYGITRDKIIREGRRLGLVLPRGPRVNWTAPEIAILDRNAHLTDQTVARKLRQAGFRRTEAAVGIYRKRHRGTREDARLDAGYTTPPKLADLLGVAPETVRRWIRRGWLKARRIEHGPLDNQWEQIVHDHDVREFLIHCIAHVDLARVDKFWLVDILAPRGSKAEP